MDRINRSDSRYLQLFTEEHNYLKTEIRLVKEYKIIEDEERELFYTLSTNLRDSQEKERARIESTKYLQLGLSIACTLLGLISAYLVNYFRNSNIKEVMRLNNEHFRQTQEILSVLIKKTDDNSNIKEITRLNNEHFRETHAILSVLVQKNDKNKVNLSKEIESVNEKLVNDTVKFQKTAEENAKTNEKQKQSLVLDKNQNEEEKIVNKKSSAQIPPIQINPYLLSASIVIGYICYLSNK
jgi:hypothetical protein